MNDVSAIPTIPDTWPAKMPSGLPLTMRKTARRWPPSSPQPNHERIAELANDMLETAIKLLVLVESVRLGSGMPEFPVTRETLQTANGGLPNV